LIDSRFSKVVCAPVLSQRHGLATELEVGPEVGLKHPSSVHCDAIVSLAKASLTDYVGPLPPARIHDLDEALRIALAIE
jgi:mRNA interferase MazF